jgi:hypothetical protein
MESSELHGSHLVQPRHKLSVAFTDDIPDDGPELFMLRLKGNQKFTMNTLGRKIRGIEYHWSGGHSEPHFNPSSQCPGCKTAQNKKWKGYLHVYCVEMRQEVFLELTVASAKSLRHQLGSLPHMRGAIFQVKRTGSDQGRVYISILAPHTHPEVLPPEKDPRPSLLALYGYSPEEIAVMLNPQAVQGEAVDFE